MKFDGAGIIGYHMGRLQIDSFARITKINYSNPGYYVSFVRPGGERDFWCISIVDDFIEIDGIRYEGDNLEAFCKAFITMMETEKAIDSLDTNEVLK
jgi:hypothetical protein